MKEAYKKTSSSPARGGRVFFPVLIVFGLLLLVVSLALTLHATHRLEASRQVQGVIVASKTAANSSGGTQTYYPVISAEDEEGQPFEITGSVSYSPPPTIGETVKLAYPPGHPQDAFVIGFAGVWFVPVVVGGLGMVVTLVGLTLLFATSVPKSGPAVGKKSRRRPAGP